MKNKGFTLVELLGAMIILVIIMLVTFPIIITQLKKSNLAISNATKTLIDNSASLYMKDYPDTYTFKSGSIYCIQLQTLVDENLLFDTLKDENGKKIELTNFVKVTVNDDKKYTTEVVTSCTSK